MNQMAVSLTTDQSTALFLLNADHSNIPYIFPAHIAGSFPAVSENLLWDCSVRNKFYFSDELPTRVSGMSDSARSAPFEDFELLYSGVRQYFEAVPYRISIRFPCGRKDKPK